MAYSTTPTTNATVSIQSSGMSSDTISISQTFELTAIDNITSVKNSTGVRRIEGANGGVVIFDADKHGAADATAWLWCHNPNTTTNGSVYITLTATNASVESCIIGKLWEGKSCLIPLQGHTGASDITVTTGNAAEPLYVCDMHGWGFEPWGHSRVGIDIWQNSPCNEFLSEGEMYVAQYHPDADEDCEIVPRCTEDRIGLIGGCQTCASGMSSEAGGIGTYHQVPLCTCDCDLQCVSITDYEPDVAQIDWIGFYFNWPLDSDIYETGDFFNEPISIHLYEGDGVCDSTDYTPQDTTTHGDEGYWDLDGTDIRPLDV